MIVEKLTVSSANLNLGTIQELSVTHVQIDDDTGLVGDKKDYRPTSIRVENISGDAVYLAFFTESEKVEYDVPNSNFQGTFKMANNTSEIFDLLKKKEITDIIVKGTLGAGHTVPLDIYVVKE